MADQHRIIIITRRAMAGIAAACRRVWRAVLG